MVNGCCAQQILTYHQPSALPEEVCDAEDIALDKWRSDISNIAVTNVEQYLVEIEKGICAQKILLNFHDYFVNHCHPEPPVDAVEKERNVQETIFRQDTTNMHPSVSPTKISSRPPGCYSKMLNAFQRHCCGPYYTKGKRKKECRAKFPHDIMETSKIQVTETITGRCSIEIVSRCNDC